MTNNEWTRPPWKWKAFLAFDSDGKVVQFGRFQVDEGAWDDPLLIKAASREAEYALKQNPSVVKYLFVDATEEGEPAYQALT